MSDVKFDDGGSAFPEPVAIGPAGDVYPSYGGMTLRDWFAGQALPGILFSAEEMPSELRAVPKDKLQEALAQVTATWAYALADAMIAARKP